MTAEDTYQSRVEWVQVVSIPCNRNMALENFIKADVITSPSMSSLVVKPHESKLWPISHLTKYFQSNAIFLKKLTHP